MGLTTVDFGLFRDGSPAERLQTAKALVNSFRECGFVRLVNHGISLQTIEEAESWVCNHTFDPDQYGEIAAYLN